MTKEEEVYDTEIEGRDDNGNEINEGDDDTGSQGRYKSQVVRIEPDDVATLEFCLVSTSTVMDLLHELHGPMCKQEWV